MRRLSWLTDRAGCLRSFRGQAGGVRRLPSFFVALVAALAWALGLVVLGPSPAVAAPHDAGCDRPTPIVVIGHGDTVPLADDLQEVAQGLYEPIAASVGAHDCRPIRVDLTSDLADARQQVPGWHLPPWAAGAARGDARSILLFVHTDGRRHDRVRVLRHELAHVAVDAAAGDHRVPRWFHEGVARLAAHEHGEPDHLALARARVGGGLLPLEGLAVSFPAGEQAAALAYAESARALLVVEERAGPQGVARVLGRVATGEPFDDALHAETGLWTWQLGKAVERSVNPAYAWMTVLWQGDAALAGAGLLAVIAGVVARRRVRRRLDAYPDDEPTWEGLGVARWTVGPRLIV